MYVIMNVLICLYIVCCVVVVMCIINMWYNIYTSICRERVVRRRVKYKRELQKKIFKNTRTFLGAYHHYIYIL